MTFILNRRTFFGIPLLLSGVFLCVRPIWATAGTSGASFLDIPVGARPAALAGSYAALSEDAYAPVWNPAALAGIPSNEIAATHLSYLESMSYEFVSFAHPFEEHKGLGVAVQYLRPGDIQARDVNANVIGNVSGYYAAGTVAYGQRIAGGLSLGAAVKRVQARLDDVSAGAWAGDVGALYKVSQRWRWAAGASNLGSKLTFLQQGDSLPMAIRLATAYTTEKAVTGTAQVTSSRDKSLSGQFGVEYRPVEPLSLRAGYRTDTTKELSFVSGFSMGIGIQLFKQEFSYAWLPMGDLGSTQYFSFLLRFGESIGEQRNLVQLPRSRSWLARRSTSADHTSKSNEPAEMDEADINALLMENALAPMVPAEEKKP